MKPSVIEQHAVLGIVLNTKQQCNNLPFLLYCIVLYSPCQYLADIFLTIISLRRARYGIPWEAFKGLRKMQSPKTKGKWQIRQSALCRDSKLRLEFACSAICNVALVANVSELLYLVQDTEIHSNFGSRMKANLLREKH